MSSCVYCSATRWNTPSSSVSTGVLREDNSEESRSRRICERSLRTGGWQPHRRPGPNQSAANLGPAPPDILFLDMVDSILVAKEQEESNRQAIFG